VLSEHEPDHSEYPYVILGVYATREAAEKAKTAKQIDTYDTEEDPEGYDFHECDIWWEVEAEEVRS
jgi:hypothetical protein